MVFHGLEGVRAGRGTPESVTGRQRGPELHRRTTSPVWKGGQLGRYSDSEDVSHFAPPTRGTSSPSPPSRRVPLPYLRKRCRHPTYTGDFEYTIFKLRVTLSKPPELSFTDPVFPTRGYVRKHGDNSLTRRTRERTVHHGGRYPTTSFFGSVYPGRQVEPEGWEI